MRNWNRLWATVFGILLAVLVVFVLLTNNSSPRLVMTTPKEIGATSIVSFSFPGKIDPQRIGAMFSVDPPVPFQIDLSGGLVNFIPKMIFEVSKTYKITVKGEFLGQFGKAVFLNQEFEVSVRRPRVAVRERTVEGHLVLTLFDDEGNRARSFGEELGELWSFCVSPSGDEAICSFAGAGTPAIANDPPTKVFAINLASGRAERIGLPEGVCYKSLAWSPKGKLVVALAGNHDTRIWVFGKDGKNNPLFADEGYSLKNDTPLVFSRDSQKLAWVDMNRKNFMALNLSNYKIVRVPVFGNQSSLSISPLGEMLFSDSADSGLMVGAFISANPSVCGKPVPSIDGKEGRNPSASDDGKSVVFVSDQSVEVSELASLSKKELAPNLGNVSHPKLSPANDTFITLQDDKAVLFNIGTGTNKTLCKTPSDAFGRNLVFTP